MSYDLAPNNKTLKTFTLGAFSFPILLEACGYLWPCIHNGGQYYCAFGADPRMPNGDSYPKLLSNDGFPVTAAEARIMARIARNLVAIQRTLPDPTPEELKGAGYAQKTTFQREDVEEMLLRAMGGGKENWPMKIRTDFTDKFEQFADWADKSGGFKIW
jgi:hypothetical protein